MTAIARTAAGGGDAHHEVGDAARVPATAPRGLPLLGHLSAFVRDRLGFLSRCAAEHGDVVPLRIGRRTLLLRHLEDVKHVLTVRPDAYEKTPRMTSRRGRRLSGNGLLTSSGEAHLALRRTLQPAFHRRAIEPHAAAIAANAAAMLDGWRDGAEVDVAREAMNLAQSNVIAALLGAGSPHDGPAHASGLDRGRPLAQSSARQPSR